MDVHQPVGDGAASLAYLSRYVFKVGISAERIVRADAGEVVFGYRKVGSSRARRRWRSTSSCAVSCSMCCRAAS